MFVIVVYDINRKRVGRALKICRNYLDHVQKSVFEGNITEGQLKQLKNELFQQTGCPCQNLKITGKLIVKEYVVSLRKVSTLQVLLSALK